MYHRLLRINWTVCSIFSIAVVWPAIFICAHDGDNPGAIIGQSGWKTFELISENDSLAQLDLGLGYIPGDSTASGTFSWISGMHDRWDGLGAYRLDPNTLRAIVNHEGTDDATITGFNINIPNLHVWARDFPSNTPWPGPEFVVTSVGNGFNFVDVTTGGSGRNLNNAPLSRLCSGNVWPANTFGTGRGFSDQLYLTGEEDLTTTGSGGSILVMDTSTSVLYEAPDVTPNGGRWENACPIDSGNTEQVVLLLSSDGGTDQLYLYVGTKVTAAGANFLERNGLVGGQVFQLDPDGPVTELPPSGTLAGRFAISTSAPLLESKFEDVHVNPNNPNVAVVAVQTDGVFQMDIVLDFNSNGTLNTVNSSFLFTLLNSSFDSDGLGAPDNLDWSDDGMIYVNEDGSGDDVWQLDPTTGQAVFIANGIGSETAGIKDISNLVGFEQGSVFLTNSYNGSATNGSNGSLYMLVSPTAVVDILLGDVNQDGVVNLLDVTPFVELLSSSTFQLEADVNQDGVFDLLDVSGFIAILTG